MLLRRFLEKEILKRTEVKLTGVVTDYNLAQNYPNPFNPSPQ